MVLGFEWNTLSYQLARERLQHLRTKLLIVNANFTSVPRLLAEFGIEWVDGIVLDLGISSFLLEKSGLGMSFQKTEPLDMRMDSKAETSAADMVNLLPEAQLRELIQTYGEERWAAKIASYICHHREKDPILTTKQLADLVSRAIPRRYHPRRIHPATKTFQALRIAVNKELDNLKEALTLLPECLGPGGTLAIISFHSLEDRLVKHSFRQDPRLEVLTKKPVVPSQEETLTNPRARSAKLRVARRAPVEQED